jgi:hypothetical protein
VHGADHDGRAGRASGPADLFSLRPSHGQRLFAEDQFFAGLARRDDLSRVNRVRTADRYDFDRWIVQDVFFAGGPFCTTAASHLGRHARIRRHDADNLEPVEKRREDRNVNRLCGEAASQKSHTSRFIRRVPCPSAQTAAIQLMFGHVCLVSHAVGVMNRSAARRPR